MENTHHLCSFSIGNNVGRNVISARLYTGIHSNGKDQQTIRKDDNDCAADNGPPTAKNQGNSLIFT